MTLKKSFKKLVYFPAPQELDTKSKSDSLEIIMNDLFKEVDTVFFKEGHFRIMKINGYNVAVYGGFSGTMKNYCLSINSLNSELNRKECISKLQELKTFYSGRPRAEAIEKAIGVIDEMRDF